MTHNKEALIKVVKEAISDSKRIHFVNIDGDIESTTNLIVARVMDFISNLFMTAYSDNTPPGITSDGITMCPSCKAIVFINIGDRNLICPNCKHEFTI